MTDVKYVDTYLGWFDNVAYLDPNDDFKGVAGYKLIAPLLLVFRKLVVHSPVGRYAENQLGDGLTAEELRRAILDAEPYLGNDPAVIVTAVRQFGDQTYRGGVDWLNIRRTPFDDDVLDPKSDLHKIIRWIDSDSRSENARKTRDIIVSGPDELGLIRYLLNEGGNQDMERRYSGFSAKTFRPPTALKPFWHEFRDQTEKAAALGIYDWLNDQLSVGQGGAQVQCLSVQGEVGAALVHGLAAVNLLAGPPTQRKYISTPREGDFLVLQKVLSFAAARNEPVRWDWVKQFRRRDRQEFVNVVAEILSETSSIRSLADRQIASLRLAEKKLKPGLLFDQLTLLLSWILNRLSFGVSDVIPQHLKDDVAYRISSLAGPGLGEVHLKYTLRQRGRL